MPVQVATSGSVLKDKACPCLVRALLGRGETCLTLRALLVLSSPTTCPEVKGSGAHESLVVTFQKEVLLQGKDRLAAQVTLGRGSQSGRQGSEDGVWACW